MTKKRTVPIIFTDASQPNGVLFAALDHQNVPLLGLIVKVKETANGDEELISWTLADTSVIKMLALSTLPASKQQINKE
jgi:hypothetical protein